MALQNFVSRSDMGWSATPAPRTMTNLGMVAHYDSGFWLRNRRKELADAGRAQHAACIEYWNRTRTQHRGQGWVDVGYAYFCCPDGYVFAGREVNHQQAAEMPTPGKMQNGNSRYVAATFALGPGEEPTSDALNAWARLRAWLMDEHGVKGDVYGHRDFTSTDCPGEPVYRLVKSGALKRGPATLPPKPTTPPVQEIDMDYASFGSSEAGPTTCAPGVWTDIAFDTEYADPSKSHPDSGSNPTVLIGKPYIYTLEFGAEVEGGQLDEVIDIDVAEYLYDKTTTPPSDKLVEPGKLNSVRLTHGFRLHHVAVGSLRKNGKLRVRVLSHAAATVKVKGARVSVAYAE